MTTHRRLPTREERNPRDANSDERSTPEIVMYLRDVHLPEALGILKKNNELLRPTIAESSERT